MSKEEKKDNVELTEKEQAVLDAINAKIEAQMESKAGKDEITALNEALDKKLTEFRKDLDYESMQKQLDKLFERTDKINQPYDPVKAEKDEKEFNQKWLRAFLKRDAMAMNEMKISPSGDYFNPSLHANQADDVSDLEQGAYAIPSLLLAEINRWVYEAGLCRREMRYLPFSGPGNERDLLAQVQAVTVSWIGEGAVKPKTKPKFKKITQRLKKMAAITVLTEEIIEDSAIDLVRYCSELFGEAIAIEEDTMFLTGDTDDGDPFDGIINADDVATLTMTAGAGPTDVTADTLNQMIYEIPTPARRGAKFYMHPELFSVIQRLRIDTVSAGDGAGDYLIQKPTNGDPASIWGYPIVLTDQLPGNDDVEADDPFMFFANLSRTSVYGDKQGMRVKMLDQASLTDDGGNTINLAEQDMVAMRVHKRVGYVNILPDGICVLVAGEAT